ncbi:hypothetical protein O181_009948 [Austropuccinia psidii MF-1]|uniref:GH18 domain-containing protein n=1 Tax=Austropuccinia psidii MF-1 TaxID=1389203 RepID=A0A9Q3BSC8_9BASI|nr:hypothetical protein [Austropuccinia psidii MF-1]
MLPNASSQLWEQGYQSELLPVDKIPWKAYNHVQYFVAVPSPAPEADLVIETKQNMLEVVAAAKANNVSVSLSVGGWTGSRYFSFLVGNDKNRTAFAKTLARAISKYQLNGLDLDWEYPNFQGMGCNAVQENDSANFLKFLKVLRAEVGPKARLSAAVSMRGFMSSDGKNFLKDVRGFGKVLDFVTIMAYDTYVPGVSTLAGPNAPLFDTCSELTQKFSVARAVRHWIRTGIPAHKLVLGFPSYGYGYTLNKTELEPTVFSGNASKTSLLFQPAVGVAPPAGKTSDTAEGTDLCGNPNVSGGQWLFRELIETGKLSANQQKGEGGYERHYDCCTRTVSCLELCQKFFYVPSQSNSPGLYLFYFTSQQPFLFNPSTRNLISYDDTESLREKALFARKHGLAGLEMFDAIGDTADSQLMNSVRHAFLSGSKRKFRPASHH